MSFILLGFSQEADIRHFAFERVAADGKRTGFMVHADVPMARRFNIKIQDLPLMCHQILASHTEERGDSLIVTAEEMKLHAEGTAAAASAASRPGKRARTPNATGMSGIPGSITRTIGGEPR
jgi:hypothetical protein